MSESMPYDGNDPPAVPVRSFAKSNQELVAAFDRYLESRGLKASTRVAYGKSVLAFVESLASASVAEADRTAIRKFLSDLLGRAIGSNTIRRHTCALRSFFKFLRLTGLTRHDPTLALSQRKLPRRIPRVLTIDEVDRLIAAAKNPLEAAVAEFLYATGVRVSELVAVRLENIDFAERTVRVEKGKGGKDRIVLFGSKADAAIRKMLALRSPKTGLLFEAPAYIGHLFVKNGSWYAQFYARSRKCCKTLGRVSDLPTHAEARRALDRILATTPGYRPHPARPYTDAHIRRIVNQMGIRAGIGRVYPHALRRAFATHLLEGGADLRVIQDLLGHERVTTTALYTSLSVMTLKEIHTRCHPTAEGNEHVAKK